MAAQVLDGKAIAKKVRDEVAERHAAFVARHGRKVGLVAVRVGNDPASEVYVRGKKKHGIEAGLDARELHLPADITQADLLEHVRKLNAQDDVDAILVQLPLPDQIDADAIIAAVDPVKDVDGFHPVNAGLLASGRPGTRACTPAGCLRLIDETGVSLVGAHAVVVGRSNIVGKPLALMLLERHATVTVCHSRTKNLAEVVSTGDVVVAAVGRAELVKGAWIKPGAIVIDVGINRVGEKKLVGDVEYAPAAERAGWITPVPGGVGPMTIALLLQNAIDCAERRLGD